MQALASFFTYTSLNPLGGVICLNGCLPLLDLKSDKNLLKIQREASVLLYHGTADSYIPLEKANLTYEYLDNEVFTDEWRHKKTVVVEQGGGHEITTEATKCMFNWLSTVTGPYLKEMESKRAELEE